MSSVQERSYKAENRDALIQKVAKVLLLLNPAAISVYGFDETGELILTDKKAAKENWSATFFEHHFLNDPLLATARKVAGVFFATEKSMIVPGELYMETEAEKWFRSIHFIAHDEAISIYHLKNHEGNYIYALPAAIKKLAVRYFEKAAMIPLAGYQFAKMTKAGNVLDVCITDDHAHATLHKDHNLLWHQVFFYGATEDIVYQLKTAIRHYNIDESALFIQYTTTGNATETIAGVQQYFRCADSIDDLHEQLYRCVS
jgi:hypothetical protein